MTKPTMKPNVFWFTCCGPEYAVDDLMVEGEIGGFAVCANACRGRSDSKVLMIYPSNCKFKRMSASTSDILGFADKIHLTKEGEFFFTFKADSGMPACDFWLNEKQAKVWINGVMANDELVAFKKGHNLYLGSSEGAKEKAQYIKNRQTALNLLNSPNYVDRRFKCKRCGKWKEISVKDLIKEHQQNVCSYGVSAGTYADTMNTICFCKEC